MFNVQSSMSYQMTQVIRKKNKKGPNYKIEKSFYYRLNRCYVTSQSRVGHFKSSVWSFW